ncbi:hypothetical protein BLNAU_21808 [Blattamonas nauphoetae]|uniref:Uncharacterized protein n=1 Tax=Blattamonas nauphoetae TaxID=2049346 RepID=A0ABQ9WVY5_9EUKA|nr:hypothetical protein BLNAU_21808 [Blattamonas nauphoetae]
MIRPDQPRIGQPADLRLDRSADLRLDFFGSESRPTPPFPLPVTSHKFHPHLFPFPRSAIALTFIPLDPTLDMSTVLASFSQCRLSRGTFMSGVGMHGFGFDFEKNRFVQMTANGMLPRSCTQYPLLWMSLCFPSPTYQPERQYSPLASLSPFANPLLPNQVLDTAATLSTQTSRADPYPIPLFSSGALGSVLCNVIVLHEDFIRWHNSGCSLFVDYSSDLTEISAGR